MVRLGLVARADNRGLGVMSQEFYRHVHPERVLIVDMSHNWRHGLYPERFPGASVVAWDQMSEETVGPFLEGLDVVITFETPYWWGQPWNGPDPGLLGLARSMGVKTVVDVMPEFFIWATEPARPLPDMLISPTTWRMAEMNEVAEVQHLPFPVARDRLPFLPRDGSGGFLHIAGTRAIHDRNGTDALMSALRLVRKPMRVVLRSQAKTPFRPGRVARQVEVECYEADTQDYWTLYDQGDILVLPRRFGGQSLPMNEAASAGMPVVATDVAPQNAWLPPESLISVQRRRSFRTQAGQVAIADPSPTHLARVLERLASDPELCLSLSARSDHWAEAMSWEALLPLYRSLFEEVANR